MLIDKFGRQINYLRLAVTDRCNIRCTYCMPAEGLKFLGRQELLTYEEMLRLVRILSEAGVEKVRLTGGEPFVRKDFLSLLEGLHHIDGIRSLHITSNGTFPLHLIEQLEKLQINSINLSLDTLNRERYKQITRRDEFDHVWNVLQRLLDTPIRIKVNVVVMVGINDQDIVDMAELSQKNNIEVRFIEQMPFNGGVRNPKVIDHNQILKQLEERYELIALDVQPGDTARNYKIKDSLGSIGIIAAHSRTFCGTCNRIRITPQGMLMNCLYDKAGLDLKTLLREHHDDAQILSAVQEHILRKSQDGWIAEGKRSDEHYESMALIGG